MFLFWGVDGGVRGRASLKGRCCGGQVGWCSGQGGGLGLQDGSGGGAGWVRGRAGLWGVGWHCGGANWLAWAGW